MTDSSELTALLRWLARPPGGEARPAWPYLPSAEGDQREAVQRDLWIRAARLADARRISRADLHVWGHRYGLGDGHPWPAAELRRRLVLGRGRMEGILARVTAAVAATFPPGRLVVLPAAETARADPQEAAAVVHGRAAAEERPHLAELHHALYRLPETRGHPAARNQRATDGFVVPHLKTSRYNGAVRAEVARVLRDMSAHPRLAPAIAPLWRPAEPREPDLEATLERLRSLKGGHDRAALARTLREGHYHLVTAENDRVLAMEFLLEELWILRDSYNIAALPVLDLLEGLVPPTHLRWVSIARERALILHVHHFVEAGFRWRIRARDRLRDPAVRWGGPEHRQTEAVNLAYLMRSHGLDRSLLAGDLPAPDDGVLIELLTDLADLVPENSRWFREWQHLVQRHTVQRMLTIRAVERRNGLREVWDDADLEILAIADGQSAALGMPFRSLAWANRRLAVLLEAGGPDAFLTEVESVRPAFERDGPVSPNQIASLHVLLLAATRRRTYAWRGRRLDAHDLLAALPPHTDDLLRHPLAVPRPLFAGDVPLV